MYNALSMSASLVLMRDQHRFICTNKEIIPFFLSFFPGAQAPYSLETVVILMSYGHQNK